MTAITDHPYADDDDSASFGPQASSSSKPSPSDGSYLVCEGNVIFLYIIPNILHFAAYVYTFCTIRNSENEQLQAILERVRTSFNY